MIERLCAEQRRALLLNENSTSVNLIVHIDVYSLPSFLSVKRYFLYFSLFGNKIGSSIAFTNAGDLNAFFMTLKSTFNQISSPVRSSVPKCG
ncbi:hypothetical protein PSEHALCIP103_03164 [Pseudoalteromonas haloplanktis]|jgi:hypothetical protein|uniref:Uncharacterized protein n=1 Tax=Pseudoalteromonas haloplanktis TaxID=228 RepID=A0A9W4R3H9_PSEHA|nr:hypothetical protein PSEHALCIP103_03164 [Pseudoalteromonas haloplanktis]